MERPDLKQALGRLLGPAEPEVGCDECFELLDRYVELELAGADADAAIPGLRAHLAGCPPAARSTRACARSSAATSPEPGEGRRDGSRHGLTFATGALKQSAWRRIPGLIATSSLLVVRQNARPVRTPSFVALT